MVCSFGETFAFALIIIVVSASLFRYYLPVLKFKWLEAHTAYPQHRYKYRSWIQCILDRLLCFNAQSFEALKKSFLLTHALFYKLSPDFNQNPKSVEEAREILETASIHDVHKDVANILSAVPRFDLKQVFECGLLDIEYLQRTGENLVAKRQKLFVFPSNEDTILPITEYEVPNMYADVTIGEDDITNIVNPYSRGNLFFIAALNSDASG